MAITIEGLSKKQKALAEIMWGMDNKEDVLKFIHSLPTEDRKQAQVVCEMMVLALFDEVETVDDVVVDLINSYKE